MKHHPVAHIDRFVTEVRDRLNQHYGVSVLVRSLAVGGALMTGVGLVYMMRGCHVPWMWYPAVFGAVLAAGAAVWWFTRHSQAQAAHFADQHFNLKDSVLSYTGFHRHGKNAGFYALQAEQTRHTVRPLSATDIRYQWPTVTVVMAIVLLLTCSLLAFIKDSPERLAAQQAQALILAQSEAINDALKDALKALEQQIKEEDLAQVLDVNALKEWGHQLRETPDIKEAMRQYAQFEKKLASLSMQLQQRRDQQLLDRIGRELQKDDTSKALGKQLARREYRKASESLSKFKIDPAAQSRAQQTQAEALKAMSGRMAQEVTRTRVSSEQASGAQKDRSLRQGAERSKDPLSERVEQLDQAAQQMCEAARQAQKQSGSQDTQLQNVQACQQNATRANRDLDSLGQHMQRMAARQQAQSRISQLLQSLSQAQQGLGQSPSPGQGQGQGPDGGAPGGQDAGVGSDSTINTSPVEDTDQGYEDQLTGTPGHGPSAMAVEEAADGSGSSPGSDTRDREMTQRQIESFIRREDVPEAVKSGVKAYFENIHQLEEGN